MARLNTATADLVAKLFNPRTGAVRAVRSDRTVLRRSIYDGKWHRIGTVKKEFTVEEWIARRIANGCRPYKRGDVPSFAEIERMENEGICEATDGCEGIEPDGHCQHGCPAWPTVLLTDLY